MDFNQIKALLDQSPATYEQMSNSIRSMRADGETEVSIRRHIQNDLDDTFDVTIKASGSVMSQVINYLEAD